MRSHRGSPYSGNNSRVRCLTAGAPTVFCVSDLPEYSNSVGVDGCLVVGEIAIRFEDVDKLHEGS
jgi:hypothetical protein